MIKLGPITVSKQMLGVAAGVGLGLVFVIWVLATT